MYTKAMALHFPKSTFESIVRRAIDFLSCPLVYVGRRQRPGENATFK